MGTIHVVQMTRELILFDERTGWQCGSNSNERFGEAMEKIWGSFEEGETRD